MSYRVVFTDARVPGTQTLAIKFRTRKSARRALVRARAQRGNVAAQRWRVRKVRAKRRTRHRRSR